MFSNNLPHDFLLLGRGWLECGWCGVQSSYPVHRTKDIACIVHLVLVLERRREE